MTPAELSQAILTAVRSAVAAGELSLSVPEQVTVERPKNKEHGDYATNVALQLARAAGKPPREVAEILGQPEGTVKSRIRTGLGRMRDALKDAGLVGAEGPWTDR